MKSLTNPVITPENPGDYRRAIRYSAAKGWGPNIIFALGTTGEEYLLSMNRKKFFINVAVDEVGKLKTEFKHNTGRDLELAVGITGKSMDDTLELTEYAKNEGADYLVLKPVQITKKGAAGFSRRIGNNVEKVLTKAGDVKVILYNIPQMTDGKNIRTSTWKKLSRDSRIVAIKDSSGESKRIENYLKAADGNAEVYVGDEILGLKIPSDGVVAGSTNILPVAWNRAVFGDSSEDYVAAGTAEKLTEFQKVYAENPIGALKYMLHKLGVISCATTIDKRLTVNAGLAERLDRLLLNKDFIAMQTSAQRIS